MVRLGGWLFKRRTWLPLPLALALLLIPPGAPPTPGFVAIGGLLVAVGELLRMWGVRHIGSISRTRSGRLGPLIDEGPFAYVRNPLYLGNIALWVGFAIGAGLVWMAPVLLAILGLEYHSIVRWEEGLLAARLGDDYLDYMTRVPRWIPMRPGGPPRAGAPVPAFSWGDTVFSERGTLIAIVVACALLWSKARF